MSHYRPTAAELIAAVAEFLETDVRSATHGSVNFHARVAANALRIVERELQQGSSAPELLGFADEQDLAAAIRSGELDDASGELSPILRALVQHRLDVSHPGYQNE
ncbi:DUF6285 domain-containing protein [Mycolicibacterium sp. CBMA 234]|uniref:DUF6285 domain-containing protein n=1 Tax=Mycolicibacterium sp. CBMA 234 TaxID=1918495 RepID=UPI001EE40666|nr:DUF6285 domain-containing protein [Mycolicibacterium sp. CBMA 234]